MSRFVSGGTDEQPTERDDAWLKAQQELDAAAIAKQDASRAGSGKSLFETLQANKGITAADRGPRLTATAAKQEAFEESAKLTNQFRSLDEDEIEFLDSVQESARAKELADRKHTREHLDEFRKQQEEAERAAKELESAAVSPADGTESWAAGTRKRKKGKEGGGIGGLKIRRTSTGEKAKDAEKSEKSFVAEKTKGQAPDPSSAKLATEEKKAAGKPLASTSPSPPATAAAGLGLGAYSSSDED